MSYRDEIRPWAVFRCGEINNICVAKFRTRTDADAYLTILRRLTSGKFLVAFDQEVAD